MSATVIRHPAAVEAPAAVELALIDLSSIAHPIYHMSGNEPDPDHVSRQIVARVRALTRAHTRAAICCDSGKSFRNELSPAYKANRPPAEAVLHHQLRLARERLAAEGFPVWSAKGFEADDLIASATLQALEFDYSVLIVSSDKDLLQLVGPRVRAMTVKGDTVYDVAAVVAKYGIRPDQIRDYLTLVGDAADNVKGAAGIGPVKAADLLKRWGTLEGIYEALDTQGTQFKPAMATALRNFQADLVTVRELITLRDDVEIPFREVTTDRVAKVEPLPEVIDMETGELIEAGPPPEPTKAEVAAVVEQAEAQIKAPEVVPEVKAPAAPARPVPVAPAESLAPAPAEYEKQLDPRSLGQAMQLAKAMHDSRLFAAYGTPHAVLSTIIAGRELGLPTMASLRAFHIVEGKHQMHADLIRALVLRSGLVEYFRCTERTPERATFAAKRKGDPELSLTYTVAEAQAAGLVKAKSGWEKNPADMCVARASSKLARLVAPEIVFGIYAPEEFD
jgi:5'-3' exonuclease